MLRPLLCLSVAHGISLDHPITHTTVPGVLHADDDGREATGAWIIHGLEGLSGNKRAVQPAVTSIAAVEMSDINGGYS